MSTGLGEIYQYILHPKKGSEEKYSAMDLRSMQDWIVARQFNGTEGIAEVNGFGGELKQYEVAVNPNRLKAMGVSIADIFNALEKNNQNTGGAYIDKKTTCLFYQRNRIGNIIRGHQEYSGQRCDWLSPHFYRRCRRSAFWQCSSIWCNDIQW